MNVPLGSFYYWSYVDKDFIINIRLLLLLLLLLCPFFADSAGCSAWFVVLGSVQQVTTLKNWFAPLTRGGGLKEISTKY